MKKTIFYIFLFFSVFLLNGCTTTAPYNPFKTSREEINKRVKTIGVKPIHIGIEVESLEEKQKEFEDEIVRRLKRKGYKVIEPDAYKAIKEPLKASMGGMYDPETGELLEEKYEALNEHVKREYLSKYDVDAILISAIVVVKASWNRNIASWHSVTQSSTGREGFWANFNAPQAYGTVPALSLLVVLEDTNGEDYYANFGGIQLAQLINGTRFVDVPKYQLLSKRLKNKNAVSIAMDPLLNEPLPKGYYPKK